MASPSELSLDCKPQSYSMLLKSFGEHFQSDIHSSQKLEDFLSRLEEERLKIDAFKRELPLCMQLLSNAMDVYKQQLLAYRANSSNNQGSRPILEEFMPLRNSNTENPEKGDKNKAGWMTSAQLWNQTESETETEANGVSFPDKENTEIGLSNDVAASSAAAASPRLGLDTTRLRNGGAFLPFSRDRDLPELALSNTTAHMEIEDVKRMSENGKAAVDVIQLHHKGQNGNINLTDAAQATVNNTNSNNNTSAASGATHRKARRCWSPDLHRRFVQALQMLGGSQVATPKQIRELMKVDGLTNDEVKSHLQKYRLHTRRPSPSPQTTGGPAPHLVVLGGIWVPPEYTSAAHGGSPALYHHHPGTTAAHPPPPHFCSAQEFYSAAAAAPQPLPPPLNQHHHHHQMHQYKAVTGSLESESGGDEESRVEEGKSESGGERKGLGALKEERREESNGSEITLKF